MEDKRDGTVTTERVETELTQMKRRDCLRMVRANIEWGVGKGFMFG